MWLDHDHVLLETKGGLQPGDADRLLLRHGLRPRSFSKYAAAVSLVRPDLPDNDVRRLRRPRPARHPHRRSLHRVIRSLPRRYLVVLVVAVLAVACGVAGSFALTGSTSAKDRIAADPPPTLFTDRPDRDRSSSRWRPRRHRPGP